GDAGLGEWNEMESGDVTESTGGDANIYHADVADFGFNVWSDDGDYSNDDFSLGYTELADLNGDGTVNLEDFAILAVWWDDGAVGMSDLAYFAENWLRQ
ncbi:MAG: hypothetical protein KAT56_00815, partial [Sedimentisphaerales bacterium]|nr:hypothetical protein [Sedimentisphaerales bacterium]